MSALPEDIVEALLDVEQATRSLSDAALQSEPDSIHVAIDERGEAVERLRASIEAARAALDEEARSELSAWSEDIGVQTEKAETALRAVLETTRGALQELAKGMRAAKAYQESAEESRLNRST